MGSATGRMAARRPVITGERLTRNERDVLYAALLAYEQSRLDVLDARVTDFKKADAEWRLYQTQLLLAELRLM